jgi:hypothetical protein
MTEHLSTDDIERIRAFADQPRYKRSPEELMPGEDED